MRYPAEKIKDAILDPDVEIRDRATSYFAKAYSDDASIMAQVIRAVETHGRQDAWRLIGLARDLRQTDESIAWVVGELNDESSDRFENYTYNLSMILVEADPALLLPREAAILGARHLKPDVRPALTDRLRMYSWDEATCWRELEAFCEAAVRRPSAHEVDLGHAWRTVATLAGHGRECGGRVLDLLGQEVAEDDASPMLWMEPLVIRLAGLIRLDAAVPAIVARLLADVSDLHNEECARSLTRIGTPAVLHAIAEAYPGAGDHFRLYVSGPLGKNYSDLAVETCLHLLGQEPDEGLRLHLAEALLRQFAPEGIEAARRRLVGRLLDFEGRGLRDYLLETCTFTGERFPEYDEWLAASRAEKEAHQKRIEELQDDHTGLLFYALEKLTGKKAADVPTGPSRRPPIALPARPRRPEVRRKVGRNEPCPCGSGKKFKKCCGRS